MSQQISMQHTFHNLYSILYPNNFWHQDTLNYLLVCKQTMCGLHFFTHSKILSKMIWSKVTYKISPISVAFKNLHPSRTQVVLCRSTLSKKRTNASPSMNKRPLFS
uniref:Uncharacterized protein n=1 Tax=Arundo donax TaxID=35708 RepID=A0A0A9EVP4_ARUDO